MRGERHPRVVEPYEVWRCPRGRSGEAVFARVRGYTALRAVPRSQHLALRYSDARSAVRLKDLLDI